jgi:AraC-like DNA-binding protein
MDFFNFNLYSSLLLPPFVHAIIFSVLLAWRGWWESRLSDSLLALLVLLFGLDIASWMLGFAGWYDSHDARTTFMFYFPFTFWYLIGPLFYFYFRSLTNKEFRLARQHLWHFVPAIIWFGAYLYGFLEDVVWEHWLQGRAFEEFYHTKGDKAQGNMWVLVPLDYAWPLFLLAYTITILRQYRKYRIYVEDHFSDTHEVRLEWLKLFVWLFLILVVLIIGFMLADLLALEGLSYVQKWYKFFGFGILIYGLSIGGYITVFNQRNAPVFDPDVQESDGAAAAEGPAGQGSGLREHLLGLMREEKPYLNPELTLNELSRLMDCSPTLLSRVINQELGSHFNEFINTYRVEDARSRLGDPGYTHLSILGIAFECGFNSKATFNRAFRKVTGQSPSSFLEAQKTNQDSIS